MVNCGQFTYEKEHAGKYIDLSFPIEEGVFADGKPYYEQHQHFCDYHAGEYLYAHRVLQSLFVHQHLRHDAQAGERKHAGHGHSIGKGEVQPYVEQDVCGHQHGSHHGDGNREYGGYEEPPPYRGKET